MMLQALKKPSLGVLLAIAITTTMDASGLTAFSALPLFPLMALFWYFEQMPHREVGFGMGTRAALRASLGGAGLRRSHVLLWSSLAFALWHLSAVTLKTGFNPPPAQVPVFLVNAAILGAIWGLLRWISGSVIVASVSQGVWNGLAYVLFGFGSRVGALGVKKAALFGPEVGILGLALNIAFFAVLWRWRPERSSGRPSAPALAGNRSAQPT